MTASPDTPSSEFRRSKPILLVVGNGSIGVDKSRRRLINWHTGCMLRDLLDEGLHPVFVEPHREYSQNANLQNFCLQDNNIQSSLIETAWRKLPFTLTHLLLCVRRANYAYMFFPGTLSTLAAILAWSVNRRYGVYLRGDGFAESWLQRLVLRKASFVLTVSPTLAETVHYYCRDVEVIRPMIGFGIRDIYLRPKLCGPRSVWNLLFVGRVEEAKGMRELMEAARLLILRNFPFRLRVVGGGPLFNDLNLRHMHPEVGAAIEFVGLVNDPRQLMCEYRQADLFVFPSYNEGFPRVLYEAMINSLPIITTLVGGIPGRMVDGHNCVAIPARDAGAIADAIQRCANDIPLMHRIAQAGVQTVLSVLEGYKSHVDLLIEKLKG